MKLILGILILFATNSVDAKDTTFKKGLKEVVTITPRYLKKNIGVDPLDLKKDIPEAITKDTNQNLVVNTDVLVWTLWNAGKDLNQNVLRLENENALLKKNLDEKEKKIAEILKRLEKLEKQKPQLAEVEDSTISRRSSAGSAPLGGGYNLNKKHR